MCETPDTTYAPLGGSSVTVPDDRLDSVAPLTVCDFHNATADGNVHINVQSPITSIKVIPPQNVETFDLYTPHEDYSIEVGCDLLGLRVTIHRSGIYIVVVVMANGDVYIFVVLKDVYFPNPDCSQSTGKDKDKDCEIDFTRSVKCGILREFPCPAAGTVQVISSDLAKDKGLRGRTKVSDVDDIITAVNNAYAANGNKPVDLVIDSHGNKGFFVIGTDYVSLEAFGSANMKKLCDGLKGKVKSVSIYACKVAQGAKGRKFIDCLSKCLGNIPVIAWRQCLWAPNYNPKGRTTRKEYWYTFSNFLPPYKARPKNCADDELPK